MTTPNTLRRLNYLWKHRHDHDDEDFATDIENLRITIEQDQSVSITKHGELEGLRDDDHWRYLTRQRHDKFGHRTYYDEFLEGSRVTLSTASIQTPATPTKDANNPLFPEDVEPTTVWDRNKAYVSVIRREDADSPTGYMWHLFYSGADTDQSTYRTGYARSVDGTAFIKPALGISSAGQNVLRDGYCNHVVYDEYSGLWVSVEENFTSGEIKVYTQENPTDVPTLVKTLTPSQSNSEGKSIIRRPTDRRWIIYYNHGHGAQDRSVSAFISNTTEVDGDWTEYGSELLSAPDQDNQFYSIYGTAVGDQILYTVARYNKTNEQIDVDLYVSRNGIDLTSIADSWIPLGSGGAWDDEMIWGTSNIVVEDDSWHTYYVGAPEDHTVVNSDRRFGRVTVNRERVGSVGTTGTITTDYMHVGPGSVFTVNADASAGTLEIEVQDSNGTAISGFAQADCDDITTDAYDHHPTWGQETIEAGTIRLVFHLTTNVTIYSFELTNTVPASAAEGGGSGTLDDLSDVDTTGLADGQGVFWRANSSTWENARAPEPLTDEGASPAILFLEDDSVAMSEPFFD